MTRARVSVVVVATVARAAFVACAAFGACVACVAFGACVTSVDVGQACKHSSDCLQGETAIDDDVAPQECVFVAGKDGAEGGGACLPVVEHRRTTCATVDDCDGAVFPIEVACTDGVCRCDKLDGCAGVVDHEHCACTDSHGEEHGFCNDTADCEPGLNCRDGVCSPGARPGDVCGHGNPCASGAGVACVCTGDRRSDCAFADVDGVCLLLPSQSCTADDQCIADTPLCVDDECGSECGSDGARCTIDADCCLTACQAGVCQ